jgi:D-aspartate ligase
VVVIGKSGLLNIMRCVAPVGVPMTVARFGPMTSLRRSQLFEALYCLPSADDDPEGFARGVAEVGRALGPEKPVLYYCEDSTLRAVSRHREVLGDLFRFRLPPAELVEDSLDKGRFARLAEKLDLPVPRMAGFSPEAGYDVDRVALRFPVIAKPLSRVGWFHSALYEQYGQGGKAIGIPDRDTLARILDLCAGAGTAVAVQEMVRGPESNIVSYHCYVGGDGRILGEFTGRKHRTYPNAFGLSSCVEVCDLPEVRDLGRSVVERAGALCGPLKLDFKRDEGSDRICLLEINTRYNLWHYPAAVAGVNLPWIAYSDQTGQPAPEGTRPRRDVLWVQGGLDRSSVREAGGRYWRAWLGRLGRPTVYDIWSWRDPLPFLFLGANKIGRRLRWTRQ